MKIILFMSLYSVGFTASVFACARRSLETTPWSPDLVWVSKNPIIYVIIPIRMLSELWWLLFVSSSFGHFPGLPLLHSKDLVHWTIIGMPFKTILSWIWKPQMAMQSGLQASGITTKSFTSILVILDRGVFMTKTKYPQGLGNIEAYQKERAGSMLSVLGWWWIRLSGTCFANSRCGIKSNLLWTKWIQKEQRFYDDGILIFNGQEDHKTIEDLTVQKEWLLLYIRPAGGVKYGWQTILAQKYFGPYEDRSPEQGSTNINGPHQEHGLLLKPEKTVSAFRTDMRMEELFIYNQWNGKMIGL